MSTWLNQLTPRVAWLAMSSLVGLTLLAAYLYLYRDAVGDYTQLLKIADHGAAELSANPSGEAVRADLAAAQIELDNLREQLLGDGARLPMGALVPFVIAELDQLSQRHRVHFEGVTPGEMGQAMLFEEQAFEISVKGAYFDLYAWLRDVERALRPMVVKHFRLSPGQNGTERLVEMQLRVVSYRLPGELPE